MQPKCQHQACSRIPARLRLRPTRIPRPRRGDPCGRPSRIQHGFVSFVRGGVPRPCGVPYRPKRGHRETGVGDGAPYGRDSVGDGAPYGRDSVGDDKRRPYANSSATRPAIGSLARISHQAACRRQKALGFHEVDRDVDDRADCGLRWPRPRGSFGPVRARAPSTVVPAMLSVASTRTGPKSSAIITAPGEKCGLVLCPSPAIFANRQVHQRVEPVVHLSCFFRERCAALDGQ